MYMQLWIQQLCLAEHYQHVITHVRSVFPALPRHACLQELLACTKSLLRLDKGWMPRRPGHSMYVRPFMFSHDGALGVHRSSASTLAVIMSPVGPYFKSGAMVWG